MTYILRTSFEFKVDDKSLAKFIEILSVITEDSDIVSGEFEFILEN